MPAPPSFEDEKSRPARVVQVKDQRWLRTLISRQVIGSSLGSLAGERPNKASSIEVPSIHLERGRGVCISQPFPEANDS